MLRATIHLDFRCGCVLNELTAAADGPVAVTHEELLDDENISFLIEAGPRLAEFEQRLRTADEVSEVSRVGESGLLVTKQACGALPVIRRNHGMLHRTEELDGPKRVFDVVVFRRADLKAIVGDLRELGPVEVVRLSPFAAPRSSLSPRQSEVIQAALEAGYFEWPRRVDAVTLAERFDISHATLLEHLRKAERTLLTEALNAPLAV